MTQNYSCRKIGPIALRIWASALKPICHLPSRTEAVLLADATWLEEAAYATHICCIAYRESPVSASNHPCCLAPRTSFPSERACCANECARHRKKAGGKLARKPQAALTSDLKAVFCQTWV